MFILRILLIIQTLPDVPRSYREVNIHATASGSSHVIKLISVYKNTVKGDKVLYLVME